MLKEFYKLPFTFQNNKNILDLTCKKYENNYEAFVKYFKQQWIKFFRNNILNYTHINKNYRSNSYIENYNRRIKLKLSKYLYGKSKTKISWPLFNYFIIQEEEDFRNEYHIMENSIEPQENENVISDSNDNEIFDRDNIDNIQKNRKWLKLHNYSCRYNVFMLLFTYTIKLYLNLDDKKKDDNIYLSLFNSLTNEILNITNEELDNGVWNLLDKYKINYPFIIQGFKQYYSITQLFSKFEKDKRFCIKYSAMEGCSNCIVGKNVEFFLNPIINFDNANLFIYGNIEQMIYLLL